MLNPESFPVYWKGREVVQLSSLQLSSVGPDVKGQRLEDEG